ncbi:MAG: OmpA family protein [Flavobacteriales bacterium]
MKKTIALLILSSSLANGLEAQETQAKLNTWTIGGNIGHIYDLPTTFFVSEEMEKDEVWGLNGNHTSFDIGLGGYIEKQLSPILGLQLGLDLGKSTGQNNDQHYEGKHVNLSLTSTWNLSNYSKKNEINDWGFYGLLGGSVIGYKADRYFNDPLTDNNGTVMDRNGSSRDNSIKFLGGFGLRRHLSPNFRVELESIYNLILNDSFDADRFEQIGNRDSYLRTSIGIAYTFGKGNSMHQVSNTSKAYYWDSKLVSDNVPTKASVNALIDEKMATTKADLEETKARLDALEADLNKQKALLDKYQMEKSKTPEVIAAIQAQVFNVYFATGSSYITNEYKKVLTQLGLVLKENSALNATAIGFTDVTGSESLNVKLRKARAEAVKSFLIENVGIDASRISVTTSTDNIEGNDLRHLNRRTDIIIK